MKKSVLILALCAGGLSVAAQAGNYGGFTLNKSTSINVSPQIAPTNIKNINIGGNQQTQNSVTNQNAGSSAAASGNFTLGGDGATNGGAFANSSNESVTVQKQFGVQVIGTPFYGGGPG